MACISVVDPGFAAGASRHFHKIFQNPNGIIKINFFLGGGMYSLIPRWIHKCNVVLDDQIISQCLRNRTEEYCVISCYTLKS